MKIYNLDNGITIQNLYDLTILKNLEAYKEYTFISSRHEYFVVQLVVHTEYSIQDVEVRTGALYGENQVINDAIKCINTHGFDSFGNDFKSKIDLEENKLQPVYIGVNFNEANVGRYKTEVFIGKDKVVLNFDLTDELVFNNGFNEENKLSRLKWLNSKRFFSDDVVYDYRRIVFNDNEIDILGRKIILKDEGILSDCRSYYDKSNQISSNVQQNLFYKPMEIEIEGVKTNFKKSTISYGLGCVDTYSESNVDNSKVTIESKIKYDGKIGYKINISTADELLVLNLSVSMFFKACSYFMGLGIPGNFVENKFNLSMQPEPNGNIQTFYVGDINCGARVKLAPSMFNKNIVGYKNHEKCKIDNLWSNYGNGSINIKKCDSGVEVNMSTGAIVAFENKDLTIEFELCLTPFKEIKSSNILGLRIGEPNIFKNYAQAIKSFKKANIGYLVSSFGMPYYKYKNFPLKDLSGINVLSKEARKNNVSLGIKYGLRSLSTQDRVSFIFNSFADELLLKSSNQSTSGSTAVDKIFGSDVTVDQCCKSIKSLKNSYKDFQILVAPQSRVNNYYLESIALLQDYANIHCISMSNPSIDSSTAERIKNSFFQSRNGRGIIELEINSEYCKDRDYFSAICTYADVLPYIDKLWFNEKVDYNLDIQTLLLEYTGVPFGIETTLSCNAPLALALLFGALPKYGLNSLSSEAIECFYKEIDNLDFIDSKFYGFWDDLNPIRIDNNSVHASCFLKNNNMLISVFNYSNKNAKFELGVETKLGVSIANKKVYSPFLGIEQEGGEVDITKPLKLAPYSGLIFFAVDSSTIFAKISRITKK